MARSNRSQMDISSLPPIDSDEHRWSVMEGMYDGSPLIVRLNDSAKRWLAHKSLGIKLGFAVPLNEPNEGGMPNPEENEQLNEVEDVVLEEVSAKAQGLYVLVLTTGTMREFVFYIAADADIGAIHEAIVERVSTHEVQCMAVEEPNWDSFKQFSGE